MLKFVEELVREVPCTLSRAQIQGIVRGDPLPPALLLPPRFLCRDWFVRDCAQLQRTRFSVLILQDIREAQPPILVGCDESEVRVRKCLEDEIKERLKEEKKRQQAVTDALQ
mmetsp:Transcript_33774/g.54203  ORF Transcript_33774/g.54203 Transcript_33774/m.54203 type:complete len:112 (+) Transcript_33774:1328-1663(+)